MHDWAEAWNAVQEAKKGGKTASLELTRRLDEASERARVASEEEGK
jgi:hypothetical protein